MSLLDLAFIACASFLGAFIRPYLGEKGKNLATKEDVEELTRKVEAVRTEYAMVVERFRSMSQFRLAALDRRLQAAQEAYALWRRLVPGAHSEDVANIVRKCEDWFDNNSLYLSAEAREAFRHAYHAAWSHRDVLQSRDAKLVKESWDTITEAGAAIIRSVELPPVHDGEERTLDYPPSKT